MAFGVPRDPTTPPDPVVIPRRRPQSVTLAGVLLYGSGALGLLSAVALLVAAGSVVDRFEADALRLGVTAADAADIAGAVRAVLLSSGFGALVLALLSGVLGRGVLRRNEAARIGALVVSVGSLGCALVRTSVTAFGGSVDWTVATGHAGPGLGGQVAQAFGEAMPGWLVGIGGGLTDLQTLGYIAVAILLLAPASLEYFRTRVIAPPPRLGPPV
jgi:hypothetical protein